MTFFEKKLTCLSRGWLHGLLLTACLLCFACRVTMYDYQAMCKVPYHHHSGARPLLSVCIAPYSPPWAGLPPAGHLQHSPKDFRRWLLSAGGTVQTHLRQIPKAVVATDIGFQCGSLLPYRISLKIKRTRERTAARLCQVLLKAKESAGS